MTGKRVLVVAPHADDEVLGCGGSIARHVAEGDQVVVAVMTGPGEDAENAVAPLEIWRAVRDEASQAAARLGVTKLEFRNLPAVRIAQVPLHEVNRVCRDVLVSVGPDVLYVPFPYDVHRDHRDLFHAFSVAWRPSSDVGRAVREIYAYETPSETHWNAGGIEPGFVPNAWTDISAYLEAKLDAMRCYKSQVLEFPQARSIEALRALAVWRGSQMGMPAAEAFVTVRRLT